MYSFSLIIDQSINIVELVINEETELCVNQPKVRRAAVQPLTATENGTYTPDQGYDGFSSVDVYVSNDVTVTTGSVEQTSAEQTFIAPTGEAYSAIAVSTKLENKQFNSNGVFTADRGYAGLGTVTVNVPAPKFGTKSIVSNGTFLALNDGVAGYSSVSVNVPDTRILTTLSAKANGTYVPGAIADGYYKVTVDVDAEIKDVIDIESNGRYYASEYGDATIQTTITGDGTRREFWISLAPLSLGTGDTATETIKSSGGVKIGDIYGTEIYSGYMIIRFNEAPPAGTSYDVTIAKNAYDGFAEATVDIPTPSIQTDRAYTVSPSATEQRIEITPEQNYDAMDKVNLTVNKINLEEQTVNASASQDVTVEPTSPNVGLSKVTVNKVLLSAGTGTANGTYSPTGGAVGFSSFTVNVPSSPTLKEVSVTPSTVAQTILPPQGYDGFNKVSVSAAPLETRTVSPTTTQQTIIPTTGYYGLSRVTINKINLEEQTVNASTSQDVTVEPTSPNVGLSKVTVNKVPLSAGTGTANGTYSPSGGAVGFSSFTVNVPVYQGGYA